MKNKIIAIDFDGTLCVHAFPEIGEPKLEIIAQAKEEQQHGARLILWTCRRDEALKTALEWCARRGLYFDAINENLPDVIRAFGCDTRKIYADEYWDDRAVMVP